MMTKIGKKVKEWDLHIQLLNKERQRIVEEIWSSYESPRWQAECYQWSKLTWDMVEVKGTEAYQRGWSTELVLGTNFYGNPL